MTRIMYDSVTAEHIPDDARMVAGYLAPSRFEWSAADWARFPNAVKVRIAIFASVNDGHVLDVEPGDATPDEAPGWVAMRRRTGVDPTVYCNASTWAQVRAEFRRQGVAEPHYWIAKYDNVRELPAGAVAKQFINPPGSGGHYDLSIVADHWPGVDEENDMPTVKDFLQEKVTRRGPGATGQTTLEATLAWQDYHLGAIKAQLGALAKAVAAALSAPDITREQIEQLLDGAVAEHMPTAAEVAEAQRGFLEELVREVVPDEQADRIIQALAEKLGASTVEGS